MPLRPLRNACLSRLVSLVSLAPVACVALAVMSAACASAARHASSPAAPGAVAARPPASPEATPSLDELRSREASAPLRDFRVRAADGAIELHVKASSPPTAKTKKQADGSAYSVVTFLVGGDVEVSCHATSSAVDPAHWVEAVLDEVHTTLTEAPKVAVEVVDGHPLFLVHTEGTLERGGVQKRHIAKFAAMHLDQGSVACVHDAVGFEATFRDVARHIATASKTPNAERAAYHSISLVRSGDQVVGFEEVHAYEGPKPGEQRQVSVSSVIYGDDERWFTSDTGWFGLVDAKGVARERALSRTGKQGGYDMTLERKSAGRFTYEGTVDGEPKKGAFTAKGPLFTRLSRSKLVAAVAREESRKPLPLLHFEERVPEAATREMVTREGPNQVLMDSGKKSYHCIVDARGVCATTWRDGSSVKLERVYVTGNL